MKRRKRRIPNHEKTSRPTIVNVVHGATRTLACLGLVSVFVSLVSAASLAAEPARLFALGSDEKYHPPFDIVELDPRTGSVFAQFPSPTGSFLIAFDGLTLYTLSINDLLGVRLWHLDPTDGAILGFVDLEDTPSEPFGFAAIANGLYISLGDANPIAPNSDYLIRVDPFTGAVLEQNLYQNVTSTPLWVRGSNMGSRWQQGTLIGSFTYSSAGLICQTDSLRPFEIEPPTAGIRPFAHSLMIATGQFATSIVTEVDDSLLVYRICGQQDEFVAIDPSTGQVRELPSALFYVDLASGPGDALPLAVPGLGVVGLFVLMALLAIAGLWLVRRRRTACIAPTRARHSRA